MSKRFKHPRQGTDETRISDWWDKYLTTPQFRYEEELVAHRAEWRAYAKRRPGKDNMPVLNKLAERLASPLYGSVVPVEAARISIMRRSLPAVAA